MEDDTYNGPLGGTGSLRAAMERHRGVREAFDLLAIWWVTGEGYDPWSAANFAGMLRGDGLREYAQVLRDGLLKRLEHGEAEVLYCLPESCVVHALESPSAGVRQAVQRSVGKPPRVVT